MMLNFLSFSFYLHHLKRYYALSILSSVIEVISFLHIISSLICGDQIIFKTMFTLIYNFGQKKQEI